MCFDSMSQSPDNLNLFFIVILKNMTQSSPDSNNLNVSYKQTQGGKNLKPKPLVSEHSRIRRRDCWEMQEERRGQRLEQERYKIEMRRGNNQKEAQIPF